MPGTMVSLSLTRNSSLVLCPKLPIGLTPAFCAGYHFLVYNSGAVSWTARRERIVIYVCFAPYDAAPRRRGGRVSRSSLRRRSAWSRTGR